MFEWSDTQFQVFNIFEQPGGRTMADTNRRKFIGGLAFAAGGLATTGSLALENDGHAAGYEVARASDYTSLIPRRAGAPTAPGRGRPVVSVLLLAGGTNER